MECGISYISDLGMLGMMPIEVNGAFYSLMDSCVINTCSYWPYDNGQHMVLKITQPAGEVLITGQRQNDIPAPNLLSHALLLIAWTFVVGFIEAFIDLLLLLRTSAKEHVIDKRILQECQKDKDKAAHEVDIDGFHIWDLWKCLPQVGVDGCHGEHRSNTLRKTKRVDITVVTVQNILFITDHLLIYQLIS